MPKKVAVVVGSLRKGSWNKKLAAALPALCPKDMTLEGVEIGDLPFYNEDSEKEAPEAWARFREQVRPMDAVLFITPEYNRGIPGVLKNAIDVGSRPYGKSVWAKKPAAVISVTPGALGAFGANHQLRQSLVFLDMPTLQQPEAYISGAAELFAEDGTITKDKTQEFLAKFLATFSTWIDTTAPKK
jgi:chromate reductase, NAD(P)H dehydrogenase (quinone)